MAEIPPSLVIEQYLPSQFVCDCKSIWNCNFEIDFNENPNLKVEANRFVNDHKWRWRQWVDDDDLNVDAVTAADIITFCSMLLYISPVACNSNRRCIVFIMTQWLMFMPVRSLVQLLGCSVTSSMLNYIECVSRMAATLLLLRLLLFLFLYWKRVVNRTLNSL